MTGPHEWELQFAKAVFVLLVAAKVHAAVSADAQQFALVLVVETYSDDWITLSDALQPAFSLA